MQESCSRIWLLSDISSSQPNSRNSQNRAWYPLEFISLSGVSVRVISVLTSRANWNWKHLHAHTVRVVRMVKLNYRIPISVSRQSNYSHRKTFRYIPIHRGTRRSAAVETKQAANDDKSAVMNFIRSLKASDVFFSNLIFKKDSIQRAKCAQTIFITHTRAAFVTLIWWAEWMRRSDTLRFALTSIGDDVNLLMVSVRNQKCMRSCCVNENRFFNSVYASSTERLV